MVGSAVRAGGCFAQILCASLSAPARGSHSQLLLDYCLAPLPPVRFAFACPALSLQLPRGALVAPSPSVSLILPLRTVAWSPCGHGAASRHPLCSGGLSRRTTGGLCECSLSCLMQSSVDRRPARSACLRFQSDLSVCLDASLCGGSAGEEDPPSAVLSWPPIALPQAQPVV